MAYNSKLKKTGNCSVITDHVRSTDELGMFVDVGDSKGCGSGGNGGLGGHYHVS